LIRLIQIALIAVALLAMTLTARAQTPNPQAKIRAMYLYQVSTLTDFPSQYKNGSFIIGVYGDDKVFDEVQRNYNTKTIGSQPIKVVKFTSLSSLERCHTLYVGADKSGEIGEIVKKFKTSSTIIVTESPGLLKSGSIVNLVIVNNNPKYEVSKTNATKSNLIISSTFTERAVKVE
jgi:hypothetical protein